MKRLKKLIEDCRYCREHPIDRYIKWHIVRAHKDIPACSFYFIPTIVYNTYPYRYVGSFVFEVLFLHWYIGIGEWCNKKESQ